MFHSTYFHLMLLNHSAMEGPNTQPRLIISGDFLPVKRCASGEESRKLPFRGGVAFLMVSSTQLLF